LLTTTEILKKVRELEIKSKKLTSDLFTGEYHSAFKGKGMSFKEVREYTAGDDIRFIDWNVSARFGHTYSKIFEEKRDLTGEEERYYHGNSSRDQFFSRE
jgi:uncharacterized protein (DUF58 family)